jgi:hypothetical protein
MYPLKEAVHRSQTGIESSNPLPITLPALELLVFQADLDPLRSGPEGEAAEEAAHSHFAFGVDVRDRGSCGGSSGSAKTEIHAPSAAFFTASIFCISSQASPLQPLGWNPGGFQPRWGDVSGELCFLTHFPDEPGFLSVQPYPCWVDGRS